MTKAFPPVMTEGMDEPCRFEGEVYDLEIVEGAIPPDLDGLMVQAVPDQVFPPEVENLHPMTAAAGGDGAVRAFRFKDGHVDYRTRFVRTERFLLERKARRSLFGNYRDPFSDDPSVEGKSRTTANTALFFHAGKLFAAKEDGLPHEIDPVTLDTRGVCTAGGSITSQTFTAHPKIDPRSGELIGYGYAARGETTRDIAYYVLGKDGSVEHEAWFDAPVAAMIHDCAITPNYTVLPIMPVTSDLGRLKEGGPHFVYEPDMPQIFGVLPRRGSASDVRWFRAPPGFTGHTINAFEEDGRIIFDVLEADGNGFAPVISDRQGNTAPPGSAGTSIVRWEIDYHASTEELGHGTVLASVNGEGPHIDPRWEMKRQRHVFVPTLDRSKLTTDKNGRPMPVMFNQLSRFDLETGARESYYPGPAATFQDPVFVPRSADAAEGDGFLIAILNYPLERRSELVVLNSLSLEAGPIARIKLPLRMRLGIHSAWIDGKSVPAWS
ncbi:carotenoid oxygenase family protein [Burkholderia gladioli]|uniref:carotenoid oxygenase family protein n=1 Tax=Burkholderia gladioli TaxID=28095 RepID=UPI000CFF79EF|nr:carotenoid oxygenase family protein [Burkholderia gladioli]MBU9172094.1 carotenoid oxygenase family protein [Burkholderia gladioli]MBU9179351.1 carotenoid oxygenase family protein [Burkholderia gladioli]MDN7807121.1 carotenoid oxygenase family protein [Burkholderia gladioli]PRG88588.1 dioxygenase [Burkholderia gladioli]